MPRISVVIPTFRRHDTLRRTLDRLERQDVGYSAFEVLVVADAREDDLQAVAAAVGARPYRVRQIDRHAPGVSAARNAGWRAAGAPLVLFLGDDIFAAPSLLSQHLAWHRRYPGEEVGVLGLVTWSRELRVTPFMRWLEQGPQFEYGGIRGLEAGWGRFHTANASVKRGLLERAGGFDEGFPFGYEDTDLAKRMHDIGFRLLYNPQACAEHYHPTTLDEWRRRVSMIAPAEYRFVRKHPSIAPFFLDLFTRAQAEWPARRSAARLAPFVPRRTPWLGRRVWEGARAVYRQELAVDFLAAWAKAEAEACRGDARHQAVQP